MHPIKCLKNYSFTLDTKKLEFSTKFKEPPGSCLGIEVKIEVLQSGPEQGLFVKFWLLPKIQNDLVWKHFQ